MLGYGICDSWIALSYVPESSWQASYTIFPHIVSALLRTFLHCYLWSYVFVTFGFPNYKKNSSTETIWRNIVSIVKFRFSEKVKKIFEKFSHLLWLFWTNVKINGNFFFRILWPSHNVLTLTWATWNLGVRLQKSFQPIVI